MRTSLEWWAQMKADEEQLNNWLLRQYRGEVTAAKRIMNFRDMYARDDEERKTLSRISKQESQHASWVLSLLHARGIKPDTHGAEDRYWRETLPKVETFVLGAAVGAHAEEMRLWRIRVIVEDDTAPKDIRDVFQRILKDEEFHARAFREMAGTKAMEETKGAHERGMALLGLEA